MAQAVRQAQGDRVSTDDMRIARVRVRAGTLLAGLKDVAGAIEGRNTIPILGNVLFAVSASASAIELTGTDLDLWVVRELACEKAEANERWFTLTLPAKPLLAVIGELDADAMVTISAPTPASAGAGLGEGRATISAGRSRFKLPVLPAEDFPLPPPIEVAASLELPCTQLADAFAAVEHAISTEETRYFLNGIYIHAEESDRSLRLATTDGHRLARLTVPDLEGASAWPAMIVARKTIGLLDRLLAGAAKTTEGKETTPAQVAIDAALRQAQGERASEVHMVRFLMDAADGGSIEILAKTIDGSFPDYTRVIPSEVERTALVDRASLSAAVKRVAVLAEVKSRVVKAEFANDPGSGSGAGMLTLTVSSAEWGEASEEVPCSYSGAPGDEEGGRFTIGFDAKYWRDALGALACDTVAMGMSDASGPVRIRAVQGDPRPGSGSSDECDRLVQVLMPWRV